MFSILLSRYSTSFVDLLRYINRQCTRWPQILRPETANHNQQTCTQACKFSPLRKAAFLIHSCWSPLPKSCWAFPKCEAAQSLLLLSWIAPRFARRLLLAVSMRIERRDGAVSRTTTKNRHKIQKLVFCVVSDTRVQIVPTKRIKYWCSITVFSARLT